MNRQNISDIASAIVIGVIVLNVLGPTTSGLGMVLARGIFSMLGLI